MFLALFIKGIIIGLAVSVPLGPIGILIIQRTVNKDRTSGFLSGMGASVSDAIYAVIAGFSLTYIIDFIRLHQLVFQIVGALMVLLLGIHIFFKNPVADLRKYRRKGSSYFQDFVSTFLITFPNPMVVFIFLAVFASSGIVFQMDAPSQAILMVGGVFLGANSWWLLLTGLVSLFRHKFNLRVLWWFNKIAGVVIVLLVVISFVLALVERFKI
ncbi:LysE family translocator [Mangrovibacterium marinum]|uniref:Threonine/homoserine/homoserine lactone efflux protein n=1 Tax=Mangrovibacterium marinum TaxID=1639118 RepID=A0A2T5BYU2_9BACT|nr:LysE family transporter [Mangrovibacterium marinum]PTN07419.1 threonine/homoserine/homoserine lactone efflux protein [Mangrovibacterium marinum]